MRNVWKDIYRNNDTELEPKRMTVIKNVIEGMFYEE